MKDISNLLPLVSDWARRAGEIQLEYFRSPELHASAKLNDADIVTDADAASEHFLLGEISRAFPAHSILSEESGLHGSSSEQGYQWVIDPLDGTTNFNAGLPHFAVSIALRRDGQTLLGVVYAPYLREMFTAVAGEGAMLNSKPVHAAREHHIERAVVATGFPVDKHINPDNNIDNVSRIMPRVRGMRRLGAAAIDICYVAAGFLDAYWELNLHEWDVAAADLIAREAGATTLRFRPDTPGRHVCFLAASPAILPSIRTLIK